MTLLTLSLVKYVRLKTGARPAVNTPPRAGDSLAMAGLLLAPAAGSQFPSHTPTGPRAPHCPFNRLGKRRAPAARPVGHSRRGGILIRLMLMKSAEPFSAGTLHSPVEVDHKEYVL